MIVAISSGARDELPLSVVSCAAARGGTTLMAIANRNWGFLVANNSAVEYRAPAFTPTNVRPASSVTRRASAPTAFSTRLASGNAP